MRDRPGHRGLRGLGGDGDGDRERRESFKDLRDLREHFPRRLRDPWRDTRFSLLAATTSEPPSPDPPPGGPEPPPALTTASSHATAAAASPAPPPPPPPPTLAASSSTPTLLDAANAPIVLPRAAASAPALAPADELMQVLERSSGSTSSGTSDMSALTGLGLAGLLSPRSGLTRRSVSERVLIPEEDLHGLNAAASPSPPPPPSTSREKRTMLRRNLTQILSCVYAVFIVTAGVVVYISSLVAGKSPVLAEAFSLYLVGLGLLYLVFLYTDIRRYLNRIKARQAFLLAPPPVTAASGKPSDGRPPSRSPKSSPRPSLTPPRRPVQPVPHDYCFSDASHAASFYLKVGAAGFCFGHLVHSSLLLAYQAMFLLQDPDEFSKCASPATLVLDVLYPVYSFLQLFFIFKYSNVIINRCEELARFALMHCLSSSLCFWVWTILRETMDSLAHYDHHDQHDHAEHLLEQPDDPLLDYDADYPSPVVVVPSSAAALVAPSASPTGPVALPLITYHKRGALDLVKFMNASSLGSSECRGSTQLSTVLDSLSPYLYPFTIEYSILVVGVLFVIWQNIGTCSNAAADEPADKGNHSSAASTSSASSTTSRGSTASLCRPPPMSPQSGFVSNVVLHADCHSANKGLFAGLIVLVGAAISIILFLLAMADSEYMEVGLTVNSVTEVALLALMTVAVMVAYCRLAKLDVVRASSSSCLLDHLLLFLCIPAFFLYAIFSIVPALEQRSYLSISTILLQVAQVLVQTPFIMDGMRRCSNCVKLRLQKPGRELVTFLIVCNVALWITDTFEIKSVDARDHRADYYGRVLWTMISHATVPLTMLYRFHSSGCLVHIWKSAYEADKQH